MLSITHLSLDNTRLVWIHSASFPPESLKRFQFPKEIKNIYERYNPKHRPLLTKEFLLTLRETQQQVRTRLCSSDSRTHSSSSLCPPPDAWTIRLLMAFPMSQKEGGASKAEEIPPKRSQGYVLQMGLNALNQYLLVASLPISVRHASTSPYNTPSSN